MTLRRAWVVGLLVFLGCQKGADTPPPEPPAKALTLKVSRTALLGTVDIPIGGPATFTPEGDSEEVEQLAALVAAFEEAGSVSVEMHLPTEDGSRGPMGVRVWQRGKPEYGEGVRTKLQEQGYQVKVAP